MGRIIATAERIRATTRMKYDNVKKIKKIEINNTKLKTKANAQQRFGAIGVFG